MLDYFQIAQTRRAGHGFNYWDIWSRNLIPHPFCIAGGLGLKIWLFNLDSGRWWDLCPAPIPAEVHSLSTTLLSIMSLGNSVDELCILEKGGRNTSHFEGWVPGIHPLISSTSILLFPQKFYSFYSVSITFRDKMIISWIPHKRHKGSYKPTSVVKWPKKQISIEVIWNQKLVLIILFFSLMEKTFKLSSGLYGFRLVY